MIKLFLSRFFDIQHFGEGSGAGGGTGGGNAGAGNGASGQTAAAPAQPQQGVKSNPLANVQYGKQDAPSAAGEVNTDRRTAKFEELIKGEYKDLYDARVQETIRTRLKGNEATVQKYNSLAPVLDLLAGKYGVKADDIEALSKAIEDDETFYEDEALEKGISVEQVKAIRKMERENAQLKAEREQAKNQEQANALYASWMQQSEALKNIYPSFDLSTELQNEDFRNLIRNSNIPIQTAYEVIHKDEIIPAAMHFTAQKVTEKVANSVRAGQRRPSEGAMAGSGAVSIKSDVSQLTRADRDEIARRVARGEKIRF